MVCAGCSKKVSLADALCPACGRFVVADLAPHDAARRAASKNSGLRVALAIAIPTVVGFFFLMALAYRKMTWVSHDERNDARAMHPVAEKYRADHPGVCPTPEQLKAERELAPSSKIHDSWGRLYAIECAADETYVLSVGRDGVAGTADDIVVPERPSTVTTRPSPSP